MKLSFSSILTIGLYAMMLTLFSCSVSNEEVTYIQSHNKEYVTRTENIRVVFKPGFVVDKTPINPNLIITVPKVDGDLIWVNDNTLELVPRKLLAPNTEYSVKVNPRYLGYKHEPIFEYTFQTKNMYLNFGKSELIFKNNQVVQDVQLNLPISSSDKLTKETLETMTKTKVSGAQDGYTSEWIVNDAGVDHTLKLSGLNRIAGQELVVNLKLNEKIINSTQQLSHTYTIPEVGDFELMGIETDNGNNTQITLTFSHPITDKDLKGIVYIDNIKAEHKYEIYTNKLVIYLDQVLNSDHKLVIGQGLTSAVNGKGIDPQETTLHFKKIPPSLRQNQSGVILPNSDQLYFPFEAVGLNAVYLEIIQIPNYNVNQFLQVNSLSGSDELYRVGKVIASEKVDLNMISSEINTSIWKKYALDLNDFIKSRESSMYHIILSFKPSYTVQPCGQEIGDEYEEGYRYRNDNLKTMMDVPYYGFGDGEDYDYYDTDNPCKGSYYTTDKWITQNVISSNFGMIAKMGTDQKLYVKSLSINDLNPQASVTIEVYDFQNRLLRTKKTDSKGEINFDFSATKQTPFLVKASRGSDYMYLRISDGQSLSTSLFDTRGVVFKEGQKAYIFSERGVWRPGDKVHLNAILENKNHNYEAPISLEVYNPRNKLIHSESAIYGNNGFYALPFSTSPTDVTGNYTAKITVGNSTFSQVIPIETIKPNRLKIKFDKSRLTTDFDKKKLEIPFHTEWLHGGKAGNLDYITSLSISEKRFRPSIYPKYSFSKFSSASHFSKEIKGKTDGNGNANLQSVIPNKSRYNGIPVFNFSTRVMEPSGEFSIDNITVTQPIFDKYIGVNINSDKYSYHVTKINEKATINLVALDNDEKKINNAQGKINIYKITWHWWWESSSTNSTTRNRTTKKLVETIEFDLQNQDDHNIDFTPEESGRYEIDICLNSGHCAQKYLYAVEYKYYQKAKFQNPTELPLEIDKDEYQSDETVKLTIQGETGQKAFITLESGTGVINQMTMTLSEPQETYDIPIPQNSEPGFYISAFLIQARNDLTIDIPMRRYGLIYVPVKNQELVLEPEINTTDFFEPNQTVSIDISESSGKPMTYSLFMVDDGLLDLTHHATPNPLDHFMSKEAHTLKTWDNYDLIMGPYQKSQRLLAIGGGGELSADELSDLSRFVPVSMQVGPFTLESGEKKTHQIDIPNYIGSVRLMVVARDKNKYGSSEKTVKVKKDLMVLGTAARRLGIGDKMVMPVTLFANPEKVTSVTVSIEDPTNNYTFPDGNKRTINMEGEGEKTIFFNVSTQNKIGMSPLKISAESGKLVSVDQINMPVINTHQPVRSTTYEIIDGNSSKTFELKRIGIDHTRKADLYISSVLNPKFESRIQNILNYPYGCNEQTTSTAFTALLASGIINYPEDEKSKYEEMVQNSITILHRRQMSNGAWALWGNQNPDPWVSNYVGHFLHEAADKGFNIPNGMIEKWLTYQKKTAGLWNKNIRLYGNSRGTSDVTQAYRLYTLALWNQAQLSDMNRLAEDKQRSIGASNFLAATYSKMGRNEKASSLYKKGNIEPTNSYYSSRLRNVAIQTMIQHIVGKDDDAIKTFQAMQNEINSRNWMSTQEVVFSLLAIRSIYGDINSDSKINIEYSHNGSTPASINSDKLLVSQPLVIEDSDYGSGKSVVVRNKGNAPINVSLMIVAESREVDKFKSDGIKITNRYYNSDNKEIDITRLKSGQDVTVETTLERIEPTTINTTLDQVVISQIFPSSWQILKSGLPVNTKNVQKNFIYQDVRDDRVHTVLDLYSGQKKFVVRTKINVTYSGQYYLPSTIAETMYDPGYYTQTAGKTITVDRI